MADKSGTFDPNSYVIPGEVYYKDVLFVEPFFGPSNIKRLAEFSANSNDIMLATYPKTGTNWMAAIMSLIVNDGDIAKANSQGILEHRTLFLEFTMPMPGKGFVKLLDVIKKWPSPRPMKTHLNYEMVQDLVERDKVRTIVMLRNPKDTIVSYYHYYRMHKVLGNFPGSFDDFFELLKANRLANGDIFRWYREWWEKRHQENIIFIFYEDLLRDPVTGIRKVAEFCGKNFTDDVIQTIAEATSMKAMKANPTTSFEDTPVFDQTISKFYRKGEVGDWKNHFNAEQNEYVDKKCAEILTPMGLTFTYE